MPPQTCPKCQSGGVKPHKSWSISTATSELTGPPQSMWRCRNPHCLHKWPRESDAPTTSVLFIDPSQDQRTHWAEQLTRCSDDYEILEAWDGQSGLALYQSRRIDCVVLELIFPDESGFKTLVELVPHPKRPQIPVVVLTQMLYRGLWELARRSGAHGCLGKPYTAGDHLHQAIQRAITHVGHLPKEDRHRFPSI